MSLLRASVFINIQITGIQSISSGNRPSSGKVGPKGDQGEQGQKGEPGQACECVTNQQLQERINFLEGIILSNT